MFLLYGFLCVFNKFFSLFRCCFELEWNKNLSQKYYKCFSYAKTIKMVFSWCLTTTTDNDDDPCYLCRLLIFFEKEEWRKKNLLLHLILFLYVVSFFCVATTQHLTLGTQAQWNGTRIYQKRKKIIKFGSLFLCIFNL